jgi:hypothetical protein
MRPREELIESLRVAMERLASDRTECRRMGEAASAEVRREHTWAAKAERVAEIYRQVLAVDSANPRRKPGGGLGPSGGGMRRFMGAAPPPR